MPNTASFRPLWARFAAWLGFLAVFAALLAPVAMLAEEVRTGQFGGLCSLSGSNQPGNDDASQAGGHCDLCGSAGFGLPPPCQTGASPVAGSAPALLFRHAVRMASSPGLPFSRGPPAV